MRSPRIPWLKVLGLPPETPIYWEAVRKEARGSLFSKSGFGVSALVTATAFFVSWFATGEVDVTALVTLIVLLSVLLLFALRSYASAAITLHHEHEIQLRAKNESIAGLESERERTRWAHFIRQDVLGDLLNDLPSREGAGDVREALIDAAKRSGSFHAPDSLELVPERLYELEAAYKTHDETEMKRLVQAIQALRLSTMADPKP